MEAYQYPQYYAIALAPSDPGREIDFFEAAIDRFSKASVHRVFELGAGTAPYLEEWHKRGYAYCGLDLSPAMIEFGREKAQRCGIDASFVLGDMRDLDRMSAVLAPGGLYLLDSFVWFRIFHDYKRSWTRRKGGVTVRTRYRAELTDPVAQIYDECLTFNVDDHGKAVVINGRVPAKVFFPQEFLALVELSGRFEFLGWYNDFSFTAELKPEGRHLTILRKR